MTEPEEPQLRGFLESVVHFRQMFEHENEDEEEDD